MMLQQPKERRFSNSATTSIETKNPFFNMKLQLLFSVIYINFDVEKYPIFKLLRSGYSLHVCITAKVIC